MYPGPELGGQRGNFAQVAEFKMRQISNLMFLDDVLGKRNHFFLILYYFNIYLVNKNLVREHTTYLYYLSKNYFLPKLGNCVNSQKCIINLLKP